MDKTIVVAVKASSSTPLYKKLFRAPISSRPTTRTTKAASVIRVEIMETRTLSKDKRWRLVKIIEKAK